MKVCQRLKISFPCRTTNSLFDLLKINDGYALGESTESIVLNKSYTFRVTHFVYFWKQFGVIGRLLE